MIDLTEKQLIENLKSVDALQWASLSGLQIRQGVPFTLEGTPYLVDVAKPKKKMAVKKGAQVRVTTTKFLEQVHACIYGKYRQNVMYMMPTVKQVEALAKISFDPIIDNNPWLAKKFTVNTAYVKTINGRSIYFVGAQPQKVGGSNTKDSSNLRSIPCDIVLRDEIDLMDEDMVVLSKQRLRDSDLKYEVDFASPTYPNYGIDAIYNTTNQNKWQIKCRSCGKYTCLVESFPDSVLCVDGRWRRSCVHCKAEIFVADGNWEPDYPEREETGYWIEGLLSPRADLAADMKRYHESDGTARAEFMRSVLGIATVEAEHQLADTDIYDRCGKDLMRLSSSTETVMGVDIGDPNYAVIGLRTGDDAYHILWMGTVDNFVQLHEIAKRMNVRMAVLDAQPDIHASRDFQKTEPYTVYRCYYSEQMPGSPKFDGKEGTVKCNRNEWCDKVYDIYASRKITLPSRNEGVAEYARQMTQTAKTLIVAPDTGIQKPRWIKLGADHAFHATLYFLLAASRTSPQRLDSGPRVRFQTCKNACYI